MMSDNSSKTQTVEKGTQTSGFKIQLGGVQFEEAPQNSRKAHVREEEEEDKERGQEEELEDVKPLMTIAEEKDAILKKLAELEKREKIELESQLRDKKKQLVSTRYYFRSQRSKVQNELDEKWNQIGDLHRTLRELERDEELRVKAEQLEISRLIKEVDKRKIQVNTYSAQSDGSYHHSDIRLYHI